jgi:hypothetical protein
VAVESIEFWRLVAGISVAMIAVGLALALYARYLAQNVVFLTRCEAEKTRADIDKVLECVEPEPAGKRIVGLMPPMGPQGPARTTART